MKNTRINGEVQKVLAEIIQGEIKDPRVSSLTYLAVSLEGTVKNIRPCNISYC